LFLCFFRQQCQIVSKNLSSLNSTAICLLACLPAPVLLENYSKILFFIFPYVILNIICTIDSFLSCSLLIYTTKLSNLLTFEVTRRGDQLRCRHVLQWSRGSQCAEEFPELGKYQGRAETRQEPAALTRVADEAWARPPLTTVKDSPRERKRPEALQTGQGDRMRHSSFCRTVFREDILLAKWET